MFNLRLAVDYLIHRLKANTRHGTHSPFVYRLVDEVIYDFRAKQVYADVESGSSDRTGRLLYRLTADWQPVNMAIMGNVESVTKRYLQAAAPFALFHKVENSPEQLEFIFIEPSDDLYKSYQSCLPKVHIRTMIVIADIYKDKNTKNAWAQIKADSAVTVTIDLFALGLVYFRKGQVKEDFKIRF